MQLKDIAVHVDDSARSETRLDIAIALAARHGACLRGVFAQSDPNVPGAIKLWPTPYFKEATERCRAMFDAKVAQAGLTARWHEVPSGEQAYIVREVTGVASSADLMILGQHDPEKGYGLLPVELVEQVILHSGRPALVIPYIGQFEEIGSRPLIAWNGGREAVRALNDALPLMAGAKQVRLVIVDSQRGVGLAEDDILHHLSCHGLTPEVERLSAEDIGVMDLMLSRVADTASDLLVMGAHASYAFPRLHRGSGTRYVLGHMTVPVLLSH